MLQTDAEELEARLTGAASPHFGHDFSQIPIHPPAAGAIQTKLAINKPGDEYEQEADRISEQMMRMPEQQLQRACSCGGGCPKCQTEQPDPGHKPASSGQPLDHQTRRFMESRFGHDFSHVRVHTDSRAAESARAVNALAYTVGQNVVFGAGQFSPQSIEGKRLLAHELAHVVQQTTATTSPFHLQRAPDEKRRRRDVVVLGAGWEGGKELSQVLAHGVGRRIIEVTSVDQAASELAKIDFPIGTLYFVTHSAPRGALRFGSAEGLIEPANIADKLKGLVSANNAPDVVDFRGCSIGTSPKAMNQIRAALGARSVVAGDCFAVINRSTPIKIGGTPITKASDVPDANRTQFEKLRKRTFDKFGAEKNCILNMSEEGFFAAGGRFVSLFFNPAFTGKWIPGKSVCYKDITPQTVDPDKALSESEHCRLIKVETAQSAVGVGVPRGVTPPP